jgi:hypothetical protein
VEFRNVEKASLFGARMVMPVALLRAVTRDGYPERRLGCVSYVLGRGEEL